MSYHTCNILQSKNWMITVYGSELWLGVFKIVQKYWKLLMKTQTQVSVWSCAMEFEEKKILNKLKKLENEIKKQVQPEGQNEFHDCMKCLNDIENITREINVDELLTEWQDMQYCLQEFQTKNSQPFGDLTRSFIQKCKEKSKETAKKLFHEIVDYFDFAECCLSIVHACIQFWSPANLTRERIYANLCGSWNRVKLFFSSLLWQPRVLISFVRMNWSEDIFYDFKERADQLDKSLQNLSKISAKIIGDIGKMKISIANIQSKVKHQDDESSLSDMIEVLSSVLKLLETFRNQCDKIIKLAADASEDIQKIMEVL